MNFFEHIKEHSIPDICCPDYITVYVLINIKDQNQIEIKLSKLRAEEFIYNNPTYVVRHIAIKFSEI